ncbi:hypothetical protein [Microbacterium aurantiacum]|uniref:hypothetical protein n=1 Tax=Microbacterium aurantiacum TaxID=162393 RepID=UPI000C7FF85C|nr:hypothetical protein [Microbacterium aurantiacum]
MIVTGFILLAVGAADLVRQFAPRRWIGYLTAAVILLLLGSVSDALLPMIAALLTGAIWIWCMPDDRPSPAGFWPAVLLGVVSIGAVVWFGERADAGLIGDVWTLRSPFGLISFDLAILVLGAGVFLLESANLVVRAALDGEHTWRPVDSAVQPVPVLSAPQAIVPTADPAIGDPADGAATAAAVPTAAPDPRSGFKGGRLIGPLERIIVLLLTLAGAYPVLAAMLAAKGIVRFPEISRDGESGARAEYFLVGSLVSWVMALGAAFLVWWSAQS